MFVSQYNVKNADRPLIVTPLLLIVLIVGVLWTIHSALAQVVGMVLVSLWIIVVQIHLYRNSVKQWEHNQRQIQALMTLYQTLSFRLPLPSLSGWTITPEFAVILLDLMKRQKCQTIVELGSGSSTLILGYMLENLNGGRVYSLDHDAKFAEQTRQNIVAHELEQYCSVLDAPLVHQCAYNAGHEERRGGEVLWYDVRKLDSVISGKIDLLIIDGPPWSTQDNARYPALPVLSKYFADRITIVLDDAARDAEKAILERWRKEFPEFSFETIPTVKGTAIMRRGYRTSS